MIVKGPPSGTVKSAMRTLDILELVVRQSAPMPANQIAAALAIPESSLAYLLGTLVERGYLSRSGRRYGPGPSLAGLNPSGNQPSLYDCVSPLVRSIRLQLNETAGFFVRRGDEIEALVSEIGHHALQYTLDRGQRAPLHSFSAGKAILGSLDTDEFEKYLASAPRRAFTPNTIVDADAMRRERDEIRRTGLAKTREEHTLGIIGLGRAAVLEGKTIGAFSVAIPIPRFSQSVEERASKLLITSVQLLLTSLAAQPDALKAEAPATPQEP